MPKYLTMYDSVDGTRVIPPNPQAVAGYVGGSWPNYDALVSAYPHAHHLSIAVNSDEVARCLDVENGDATPSDIPLWLRTKAQPYPVLYAPAGTMQAVIDAAHTVPLDKIPGGQVFYWSAHVGRGKHICSPSVCGYPHVNGTQWTWTALGRNLDQSLLDALIFPVKSDPMHYDRYLHDVIRVWHHNLSERATVREYDKLRKHPRQHGERLAVLRSHCKLLRDRVSEVAHRESPPAWGIAHRGWRWQELNKRVNGEKLT